MVSIHGGPGLELFPSMLLFPAHTKNMFTHADASIINVKLTSNDNLFSTIENLLLSKKELDGIPNPCRSKN